MSEQEAIREAIARADDLLEAVDDSPSIKPDWDVSKAAERYRSARAFATPPTSEGTEPPLYGEEDRFEINYAEKWIADLRRQAKEAEDLARAKGGPSGDPKTWHHARAVTLLEIAAFVEDINGPFVYTDGVLAESDAGPRMARPRHAGDVPQMLTPPGHPNHEAPVQGWADPEAIRKANEKSIQATTEGIAMNDEETAYRVMVRDSVGDEWCIHTGEPLTREEANELRDRRARATTGCTFWVESRTITPWVKDDDGQDHVTDGGECWCNPRTETVPGPPNPPQNPDDNPVG